jgi:hypothetical protein
MRWLHIVLSAVLIIFAALQYNDPDPYFWGPIYGLAALCGHCSRPGARHCWAAVRLSAWEPSPARSCSSWASPGWRQQSAATGSTSRRRAKRWAT